MTKSTARTGKSSSQTHSRSRPREPRRRQLRFTFGARGREIGGLLLIVLAILSLLTLFDPGSVSQWWVDVLRSIFGWGAFVVVILIGLLGGVIFRVAQSPITYTPWRTIIGLEIAFFAALGAMHALTPSVDLWKLQAQGNGGGAIGWALSAPLLASIGQSGAGIVFVLIGLSGLAVAFKLPWSKWASAFFAKLQSFSNQYLPSTSEQSQSGAPPVEEEIVPPKPVTIKARKIDQPPLRATQLPLKIVKAEEAKPKKIKRPRTLPALDLLEEHTISTIAEKEIERKSRLIEDTLRQFGLEVKVTEVSQGPAVTQFGVEPGYIERMGQDGEVRRQKVRVGQISSLSNDLALALAAQSLRIEAPVPGRAIVGIEVPNDKIAMVGLRGVLQSSAFQKIGTPLAFSVGRDVSGAAVAADLAAMPHILIAGTTGSGKSVCINAIIMSLIMNNTPEDLRLVMIDPKMVELIRYNGVPHLYGKVETEMERIVGVLRWVTREMDGRYKKFAEVSARHVNDYNAQMIEKGAEKLPYIAVLIDELSDLMLSAPVEIEKTICRIAQMARATGIHLVIATQRPSTDVVTGLIKANFPARIAFSVASGVDSRVILDAVGAETLLGKGDMLFLSPTAGAPVRVQGCYVSENEIDGVVKFWADRYADEEAEPAPWESNAVTRLEEIAAGGATANMVEDDDEVLLAKAIELVKRQHSASASLLQRKMRLGYPKAAYLIDRMEEMGIIGPAVEAGRTREVLLGRVEPDEEEWG